MGLKDIGAVNDMPRGWASKDKNPFQYKVYIMWKHLVTRALDIDYKTKYPCYKDVTVCEEFKILSNFYNYIQTLSNFKEFTETYDSIKWTIDKDGLIPGNKVYSPGKIRLVTLSDNVRERNSRYDYSKRKQDFTNRKVNVHVPHPKARKPLIGINQQDGTILIFSSGNEADNAGFKTARQCAKGKKRIAKGYVFKFLYMCDRKEYNNE